MIKIHAQTGIATSSDLVATVWNVPVRAPCETEIRTTCSANGLVCPDSRGGKLVL
jgi:hypothetical protein